MSNSVYEMKLHDVVNLDIGAFKILRVPGGWIYYGDWGNGQTCAFVPLIEENE